MIAIINYRLSNLKSVSGALDRLGAEHVVTNDIGVIKKAAKLILPGVGAFGDGMKNLNDLGLVEPLTDVVVNGKKPILGICLGAQLMCRESFEFGHHDGLKWIDASVVKIETDTKLRIPHVGWNDCYQIKNTPLYEDIPEDALFYYVHSYFMKPLDESEVYGQCNYGIKLTSFMQKENVYAVQFHPEKSQLFGLKFLENFIKHG